MRLQRHGTVETRPMDPTSDPGGKSPQGRTGRRYDPAWNDWNAPRRWPGILLSCAIVLGFLSVLIWHLRPHSVVHHPKVVFSQIHLQPPFSPAVKGTRAISFSGTHDRGGMHFVTTGGLLVLHAQCTCQYNFVVKISNKSLIPIAFPVNTTGVVNAVINTTVPAGPIVASVVGRGKWSIQLIQPLASMPAIHTPFKYFSAGNDVVGPFSAANRVVSFKFLSLTGGLVSVHVVNELGVYVQTPFAGRIAVSASKTLRSLPNLYFLEIDAGGFWNLQVHR